MTRAPKVLTELLGSFLFFTVIALSGGAGALAPLAIGGGLMAMVYMGGHVSGAHYNPAVTLAVFLRRKIDVFDLASYWAAQLVGGSLGFVFGYLVSGKTPGIHPAHNAFASALALELVFTAALVLVVLNVAVTRATQGNSFYGLAIGFTIVVAAFTAGPISGGAFNPAVGFGATLGGALYAGGSWSDLWIYVVGPLLGGAIGAGVHALQTAGLETAPPPEGYPSPGAPAPVPEPRA